MPRHFLPPRPPPSDQQLLDKYVQINPAPVHPDLDIIPPGKFTIQIGLRVASTGSEPPIQHPDLAFVYRPDGTCVGKMSVQRLGCLKAWYDHVHKTNPQTHQIHTAGSFEQDVASLLVRYHSLQPTPQPKPAVNTHWVSPPTLTEALCNHMCVTTHRFTSPLAVPTSATQYYSVHQRDALFGATHRAYSTRWTGSSMAHVPFTGSGICKAIRWAIASAQSTTHATCTLMLVPAWVSSAFTPWLNHSCVTILDTYDAGGVPFTHPCYLQGVRPNPPAPKWPIHLISIANKEGMDQCHMRDFSSACQRTLRPKSPGRPSNTRRQPKCMRSATPACLAWGPPTGFPADSPYPVEQGFPLPHMDRPPLESTLPAHYPTTHTLCWAHHPALYTDGACTTQPDGPNLLGAAFYCTTTGDTYLVEPCGKKETNTINRAELAGIYAALMHASESCNPTSKTVTIFSDSLVSIYNTQRILRRPQTLVESKHYPLLLQIHTLIMQRAHAGHHTILQKVKSHIGIIGNEKADEGARDSMENPALCQFTLQGVNNQYLSTLPAWPCLASDPAQTPASATQQGNAGEMDQDGPYFLSNLTTSITEHVIRKCPDITDGPYLKPGPVFLAQQALNSISLPLCNNHMWHTSACNFTVIRNILRVRYNLLWTAALAAKYNKPYQTKVGTCTNGCCPICPVAPPTPCPRDTVGHILGSCAHPEMHRCYIDRHNKSLSLIHAKISQGTKGGCFMIMDATSRADLPAGVSDIRLPQWMLPNVPPDVLSTFRPDLLLIDGLLSVDDPFLDADNAATATLLPAHLRCLQEHCTIHIVEFTYTIESSYDRTLARKRAQHAALVLALTAAGWTIHAPQPAEYVHLIIIGSTGTIFSPIEEALLALGIPARKITKLLQSLHQFAVLYAASILRCRRRLENSVSDFHPTTLVVDDPP